MTKQNSVVPGNHRKKVRNKLLERVETDDLLIPSSKESLTPVKMIRSVSNPNLSSLLKNISSETRPRAISTVPYSSAIEASINLQSSSELNRTSSEEKEQSKTRECITFFGSGQVVAIEAAMIALANKQAAKDGRTEDIVDIVIVGRQGSKTLRDMKQYGINVRLKKEDEEHKNYHPIIEDDPDYAISFIEYHKDNPPKLAPSDHIVLGVKSFDYNEDFYHSVRHAITSSKEDGRVPTLLPIQNGFTPWFMFLMAIPAAGHTKSLEEEIEIDKNKARKARLLSNEDAEFLLFAKENGLENLYGCVVNISAERKKDKDGRPYYISYTPVEKMTMPTDMVFSNSHMDDLQDAEIDFSDASMRKESLKRIFKRGGISTGVSQTEGGKATLKSIVFRKICFNAVFNSICTLSDSTVADVIYKEGKFHELVGRLVGDIAILAEALQVSEIYPSKNVYDGLEDRSKSSGPHYTSTWNDFMHCHKPENVLERLDNLFYNTGPPGFVIRDLNVIFKDACSQLFTNEFVEGQELFTIQEAVRDLGIEDEIFLEDNLINLPSTIEIDGEEVPIFDLKVQYKKECYDKNKEKYLTLIKELKKQEIVLEKTQEQLTILSEDIDALDLKINDIDHRRVIVAQELDQTEEESYEIKAYREQLDSLLELKNDIYGRDQKRLEEQLKSNAEAVNVTMIEKGRVELDVNMSEKEYDAAKENKRELESSGLSEEYQKRKNSLNKFEHKFIETFIKRKYEEYRAEIITIYDDFRKTTSETEGQKEGRVSGEVERNLIRDSQAFKEAKEGLKKYKTELTQDEKEDILKEQGLEEKTITTYKQKREGLDKVKSDYLAKGSLLLHGLGDRYKSCYSEEKDKRLQELTPENKIQYNAEIKLRFDQLEAKKISEYWQDKKIEKDYPRTILAGSIKERLDNLIERCANHHEDKVSETKHISQNHISRIRPLDQPRSQTYSEAAPSELLLRTDHRRSVSESFPSSRSASKNSPSSSPSPTSDGYKVVKTTNLEQHEENR